MQGDVLAPLERLDWADSGVTYTAWPRDRVLVAVVKVVELMSVYIDAFFQEHPNARSCHWRPEEVLDWYERLHSALMAADETARVHVSAC